MNLQEAIGKQHTEPHNSIGRELSQAERLKLLDPKTLDSLLKSLPEEALEKLLWDWNFWARPKQLAPPGEWKTWLIRAGRGFGKTRTGTQWLHERALNGSESNAIIVDTPADFRDHIWDGPGGFRNVHPKERPTYRPTIRRLQWPNGAMATVYSAEDPEQLRGFSGSTAWLDEAGKYRNLQDVWDNLSFGMREVTGDKPRRLITTTPRPVAILKKIQEEPETHLTIGSSYENASNLDPSYYSENVAKYEGTRLGRQEIYGDLLVDVPDALFKREWFDNNRLTPAAFARMQTQGLKLVRLYVGADPSGVADEPDDSSKDGAEVGIVVAAVGSDDIVYVLADDSVNAGPTAWGKRIVKAYRDWEADKVIAEKNFGGGMVQFVIASVDKNVPVELVTASRGKVQRADPVAVLYEKGEVRHVGYFGDLEEQLLQFAQHGYVGGKSPDRADAAIWAITKLKLGRSSTTGQKAVIGMY